MEGKRTVNEESTHDENVNSNGKRRLQREQLQLKPWGIHFKWNCNHCDRSFAQGSLRKHLLTFHKTEFESSNSSTKDHFTKGELKGKQDETKPVKNFKWNCNHCDRSFVRGSLKKHLLTFHKTEFESSNSSVNDHCTKGEKGNHDETKPHVVDFKWSCNHCLRSLDYHSLKNHLLNFHKTELESSNLSVSDHFTKGELKSNSTRMKDFKWNCNHCDRSFVYSSMKNHLLRSHKIELESSDLSFKDHFTKGELRSTSKKIYMGDYTWICRLCEEEIRYDSVYNHLTSHRKGGIEIGSSFKDHFIRGKEIDNEDHLKLSGREELRSSDEDSGNEFLDEVQIDSGINGEELRSSDEDSGNEFPVSLPIGSSQIQESDDDDNFDTSDNESMVLLSNAANLFGSDSSDSEIESKEEPNIKCVECHWLKRQKWDFENQIQKLQHEIDISNRINDHQNDMNRRLERQLAIALVEIERLKAELK